MTGSRRGTDVECNSEPEMCDPPAAEARKLAGTHKYPSRFNSEWTKKWPCIQAASNNKFACILYDCREGRGVIIGNTQSFSIPFLFVFFFHQSSLYPIKIFAKCFIY